MKKSDFMIMYPDVTAFKIEFKDVISRTEVEKNLAAMCESLETGLLAYNRSGKWVEAFTSEKFYNFIQRMGKDSVLTDLNGEKHTVISEAIFFCGVDLCVRTISNGNEDVYPCTFFNPNVTGE